MAERRLLLLDREGTVLRAPADVYVRTWDDVEFAPRAVETIVAASGLGYVPALVTNQSCVNRGIVTQAWVDEVNAWIVAAVKAGGGPDFITLSCPHVDADDCACRKPRPGMLVEAARLTSLPLEQAFFVGDSDMDAAAAAVAGVARFLRVCGAQNCGHVGATCIPDFASLACELAAAQ